MRSFKDLVTSKVFIGAGIIVLLFLGFIEFKQFSTKREVQKEIDDLTKQQNDLQKNNSDLQSLIAYLKTDDYKEKAAREQLKLKKDGEVVYSFAQPEKQQEPGQQTGEDQQNANNNNLKKWWNYFFNAQP